MLEAPGAAKATLAKPESGEVLRKTSYPMTDFAPPPSSGERVHRTVMLPPLSLGVSAATTSLGGAGGAGDAASPGAAAPGSGAGAGAAGAAGAAAVDSWAAAGSVASPAINKRTADGTRAAEARGEELRVVRRVDLIIRPKAGRLGHGSPGGSTGVAIVLHWGHEEGPPDAARVAAAA